MRICLGAALVAIAVSSGGGARAEGPLACEREMTRAAALHGVPLNVLYSVGLTETGRRGELSPYDMNVDGQAVHSHEPRRSDGAFCASQGARRRSSSTSAACRSITASTAPTFVRLSEMFDPVRNVDYAANFLKSLRGAGRLVDPGGGPLQCRPRRSGGGEKLRVLGDPQHDRERVQDGGRPTRARSAGRAFFSRKGAFSR